MVSETTPLTSGEESRTYLFLSQRRRNRRTKIRQFQCCVCAAILGIFVTAMVVTVSYSMNHDTEDGGADNETEVNQVLEPVPVAPNQLNVLLAQTWPLPEMSKQAWQGPMPTDLEMAAAIAEGEESLKSKDQLEARAELASNGSPGILKLGTPSYAHQQAVKTSQQATDAARVGYVIGVATKKLTSKTGKYKGSVGQGPPARAFSMPPGITCPDYDDSWKKPAAKADCPPSPYRSIDGTCNNLVHADWGVTMKPFRRMLPPDYADGVSEPRVASDGSLLPSARDVSLTVHRPVYRNDPNFTVMLAVWGQFFDHDITATALSKSKDGAPIACCTEDGTVPPEQLHPECYPVVLSAEDPYYSDFNMTCMEFIRSAPAPVCNFGPREQMNQITSFIDASVVYGAVEEQAKRLRNPNGKGELLMMVTPDGRELLPPSTDPRDGCNTPEMNAKGKYCFMSGDSRANENMHLTTMHLLLAREHNRIVRQLSELNPTWDDEKLYQEGRRIVAAEIQHITYKEFLPVVLGKSLMEKLNLDPEEEGYSYRYNPDIDPSVANNFATAAFRFAHTLLPTLMRVVDSDNSSEEYVELHKMLFNPYALYSPNKMENSIKGALQTDIQRYDTYLTPELTQHLFQQRWTEENDKQQEKASNGAMKKKTAYGLDLASLNVQRGRDHGLPSYVKWRKFCGLSIPKDFSDLRGQMDDAALQRLATLFKSVEDVDLYSGSLSEIPIGEGLLGPTFSCLIADQFVRLKFGDRYWYETSEQPQAFTPEQLQEIRKSSLAAIICDNSGVERAQPEVMRSVDASNQRVPCSMIPRIQLEAWKGKGKLGRVKVGQQSLRPTVMAKSVYSAASTFIKGTIISGSITAKDSNGNSETFLDSSSAFPMTLPLHLFDKKVNTTTPKTTDTVKPPVYTGPSILTWTGTLTLTDNKQAHATGNFTAPYYTHGLTPFDFSVMNYTGNFDITIKLENNVSSFGLTSFQGTYNSGIHFKTEKYFWATTLTAGGEVTGNDGTLLPQAPILLYGTYSPDGKSFDWNGNISLVLPPPTPTTVLTKSNGSSNSVLVKATWGLITATSGPTPSAVGDTKTVITKWWDGTFPVAIPQPAFDRIIYNDFQMDSSADVKPESGITWTGSLSPKPDSTTGEVQLNGSYSFPVFTHEAKGDSGPSIYAEKFWRGNFSFVLQPFMYDSRPLISSLSLLAAGGQFKTPIFFRSENETLKMTLRGVSKNVGPIVPVILHGYTSIDKSVFFWSGNATIVIPEIPTNEDPTVIDYSPDMKKEAKVKTDDNEMEAISSYSIPLDMNILSALVNVTISTSPKVPSRNISWNGEFPLTIPQPAFFRSTPPPTTSLSEIDIDDDYPYYSPLAKTGTYKSGVTWSNISTKMLDTSETTIQINGSFSFPIYYFGISNTKPNKTKPFWTGPTIENWSGVFQTTLMVNVTAMGNETLALFKSIISEGQFISSVYFSEKKKVLTAYERKSPSKPVDPMEIIIMLHGSKSPDKTEFYWNGEATLLIPLLSLTGSKEKMQDAISIAKKISASSNSYFMGSVASGSIIATSSKANVMLWSGEFPLAIEMPAFDAVSPNAGVWKWPYTTPFYNGTGGVTWGGTITKSSGLQNRVSVKGDFTVPIFVHGNPSAFEVIEWNGDFQLEIDVNVNRTGSVTPFGQGMYNSPIFFRDMNHNEGGEDGVVSEIKELLGMETSNSSKKAAWVQKTRVPLILWGNYSDDRKVFYWGGNISAIFPAAKNYLYSTANYVAREKAAVIQPERENRLRVPFKVISGSVSASSSIFPKRELWDGNLPIAIPTSFFLHKGQLYLGGPLNGTMHYAPTDSLLNGAQMEGLVSIPVFTDSNVSSVIFHKWSGEFSLIVSFPEGIDFKKLIPSSGSFVCRTFLGVPDADDETVLIANNKKEAPTVVDYMMDSLPEFSYTNAFRAPLVLLGEFSPDREFFFWSGDAVLYIEKKPKPSLKKIGMNQLQLPISSPLQIATGRKIVGTVTGGMISGGIDGDYASTLWDGSFPANIHLPFFNEYSNSIEPLSPSDPVPPQMKIGLTWQLTSVLPTADGVQIQGTFAYPKYTHGNFGTYTVTLWKGDFSFTAIIPGDQSTAKLIKGSKYTSTVHFQKSYEGINFNLRDENYLSSSTMQPSMQKSIIILRGMWQKSSFLWSGKFVIIFPWSF